MTLGIIHNLLTQEIQTIQDTHSSHMVSGLTPFVVTTTTTSITLRQPTPTPSHPCVSPVPTTPIVPTPTPIPVNIDCYSRYY
jgi:hypothetical protein